MPVGRVVEVSDGAAEGTILLQHPAAGRDRPLAGEGASLLVSRGPRESDYVMPDLIGRRAGEVLDVLRLAGLKVADVRYRTLSRASAPGIVLRQVPAAGHRVSPQGRSRSTSARSSRDPRPLDPLRGLRPAGRADRAAERGGAGVVHVDVMDGHFVPNITIGPAVVKAAAQGHEAPARLPPDDRERRALPRRLRRRRRVLDQRARRGAAPPAARGRAPARRAACARASCSTPRPRWSPSRRSCPSSTTCS